MGRTAPKRRSIAARINELARLTSIALVGVATVVPSSIAGPDEAPEKKLTSREWREDLEFMARTLFERHPNAFHGVSREKFMLAAASRKGCMRRIGRGSWRWCWHRSEWSRARVL